MCFLPTMLKNCNVPTIFLHSNKLDWVQDYKYLGVHLSSGNGDNKDMKRQISYIYAKGNVLIRKFHRCCDNIKVLLFKTYCYSLYCCHLWADYKCRQLNNVKVAYNNVFRSLFGISRRCHVSPEYLKYTIDNFTILLRKHIVNFRKRLYNSDNLLILTVIHSAYFLNSSTLYKEWTSQIF